jgi:hypothetical protein
MSITFFRRIQDNIVSLNAPFLEWGKLLALPWKTAYTQTLLFRLMKAAREAAALKSHTRFGVTP